MVRLGLCCTFAEEPIKFRHTTVRYASSLSADARTQFLDEIALHNARTLKTAIEWCAAHGVGAFRIMSQLLPLYTHPEVGWSLATKPALARALRAAGAAAKRVDVRLSFHPDQFVVPGSLSAATVAASLRELEYQAEVAELVGAEQLTIHGGGAQGGKEAALARLEQGVAQLSPRARSRIVLENDDRLYTVEDLLPVCERLAIPLVYDVHHHRCNPDRLDATRATELAAATWGRREQWVHLSSPIGGWRTPDPRPHADEIDPKDIPKIWLDRAITIDVEAKSKERAVLALRRWLDAPKTRRRVRTAS